MSALIIRPAAITDANLTSNVVEIPPAAHDMGTTYAAGAQASVLGGPGSTAAAVYESLQAGNTGHAPGASPLWWTAIGTAYLAYDAGTSYPDLAVVTDPASHLLYASASAGNLGNALTDTDHWTLVGPTNRWAMFDTQTRTRTTRPGSIVFTHAGTGRIDSVALFNLVAATVRIQQFDGVTPTFDQTFSLNSSAGIIDPWTYCFEPIVRKTQHVHIGLPNIYNPITTVTVTAATGQDAAIGHAVFGLSRDIGGAEWGFRMGGIDYSKFEVDEFGENVKIIPRTRVRKNNFTIEIDDARIVDVLELLNSYHATPVVFVGTQRYASAAAFGLIAANDLVVSNGVYGLIDIEVKGF